MNREELRKAIKERREKRERHLSYEERDEYIRMLYDYESGKGNRMYDVILTIEEMGELLQVIGKVQRGKIESNDIAVIEEITDVKICLDAIVKYVFGFSIDEIEDAKTKLRIKLEYGYCRDKNYTPHDRTIRAIGRLTKLLADVLYNRNTEDEIIRKKIKKRIAKVMISLTDLIYEYKIDARDISYADDIKIEKGRAKFLSGGIKDEH